MSAGEWVGLTCTLLALLVLWLYRNTPSDTDVWPHGDPAADDDHPHPDDRPHETHTTEGSDRK